MGRGGEGKGWPDPPLGSQPPDCPKANDKGCAGRPRPAGALLNGASRYGALDMAGNVEEWVADWSDPEYYALSPLRNPAGPESGSCRQRCRVTAWRPGAMQTPRVSTKVVDAPLYVFNG